MRHYGKPLFDVWLLHRTPEMIAAMERPEHLARLTDPQSSVPQQPPHHYLGSTVVEIGTDRESS